MRCTRWRRDWSSDVCSSDLMSYGGDSRSPETQQRTTGWGGVAVAAILAAGLASAGTAAITNATDDPAAPPPGAVRRASGRGRTGNQRVGATEQNRVEDEWWN